MVLRCAHGQVVDSVSSVINSDSGVFVGYRPYCARVYEYPAHRRWTDQTC